MNLHNPSAREQILARIKQLTPAHQERKQWGVMRVEEMLCHLADQIRVAIGEKKVKMLDTFFSRTVLKQLALSGMPMPKGKVETVPEVDALKQGTKPTTFEQDRQILVDMINEFASLDDSFDFQPHPRLGAMSRKQWSRMAYLHIEHHLKQFSA